METERTCQSCTYVNKDSGNDCCECERRSLDPCSLPSLVIEESGRGTINDEMRIVLLGRTGAGKSTTGNTITGRKYLFRTEAGGSSLTRRCEQATAERFGYKLQVVDTPGLFDTGMTQAQVIKEVVKCIGMTSPGPHAFIFVTRIDRFTKEEQDTLQYFKDIFGDDMMQYVFVLFTRRDDLEHEGHDMHSFVKNVPQMLKDILQECNMRYIGFNNRLLPPEGDTQVQELLDMIETNIRANGGRHFMNEMYRQAEEAMVRREAALREELEGEKQREKERMKVEFEKMANEVRYRARREYDREDGLKYVGQGIWEGLRNIFG